MFLFIIFKIIIWKEFKMACVQISEDEFYQKFISRTGGLPGVIVGLGWYIKSKKMTPLEILNHLDSLFPDNLVITIELMKEKLGHIDAKCERCKNSGKFMYKCGCGGYIMLLENK